MVKITILFFLLSLSFGMSENIDYYSSEDEIFADVTVDNLNFIARVGGIDNDGDGFVDCDDWDCSYNNLIDVCSVGICER